MISALDISTSALVAQRIRLDTIAGNIANANSLQNEEGEAEPYKAKFVVFETDSENAMSHGAAGVKVKSVETEAKEPLYRWEPDHPLAIQSGEKKGYVAYPNIDLMREFVDSLAATRAYEANIGVIEVTKNLGQATMKILA